MAIRLPRLHIRREAPPPLAGDALAKQAVAAALRPSRLDELPPAERAQVEPLVKAMQRASGWNERTPTPLGARDLRPVSAAVVARRAAELAPASSITPLAIADAMHEQGLDYVQPFPPGQPLQPYYGFSRRPRQFNYQTARNTTTTTRPTRIPFRTLLELWKSYDVAQICFRYSANSLRSMRVRFQAMDGYDQNPVKDIEEAKRRMRRPDGRRLFRNWLTQNQRNLWIFDSAPIFRQRDRAGRVQRLLNFSAMTLAPMLDYFGDFPASPAPAFQQFITGVPWDWLTWDDVIYEPFWPETDSPYGTPPLETVLINANTDIRLQLFFLDFFTKGQVPEALAIAPEDMTSADDLADFQEQYNSETYGDQAQRWGLKWLPHGTELEFYKPMKFDPDLAEYVMRRTIAAHLLTPQNLGIMATVNRAAATTQVDQEFRVSTLPTGGYYEDLLDSVLQETWTLPVQIRFDTGREKEDRLTDVQAWSMGIEYAMVSPTEARDKLFGLPTNPEERIGRGLVDARLGWIPAAHLMAVQGDVDALTSVPKPGTVEPVPYDLPGGGNPVPAAGPHPAQPKVGGAGPKGDPTKAYPRPLLAGNSAQKETDAETPPEVADGYARIGQPHGSGANGTAPLGAPELLAEADDLRKWHRQSRRRAADGKAPRLFVSDAIRTAVAERVWKALEGASTRQAVDAAFKQAGPLAGGLVVQAEDTGRVLLVQRTPDKHDPAEAFARWEFPGGHLDGQDPWSGARREWEEETGADLPLTARHVGNWTSPDGAYVGFVLSVPREADVRLAPQPEEVSQARWWAKEDLDAPQVRDKVTETLTRVTPLLKGWTTQPRDRHGRFSTHHQVRWEQFHRHTDRIIAHYAPLIQKAFAKHLTRPAAHRVVQRAYAAAPARKPPTAPLTPAAAAAAAASGALASVVPSAGLVGAGAGASVAALQGTVVVGAAAALVAVVSALYADAYLQGAHEASDASGGSMPPWTVALSLPEDYWTGWTPGVARAAQSVAGTGLAQLLAEAGVVIGGVDHTQLERIGDAISHGLDAGTAMSTVIAQVDTIIDTPTRAKMIAETEYMRAMARAQMDTYQRNGVPEVQWLHEPGACGRCMENVAASPQPARNPRWPQGPIPVHPLTRCVVAPYYGSLTGRKP